MEYGLLVGATLCSALLSIFANFYTKKNSGRQNISYLYNYAVCVSAVIVWGILYAFNFSFHPKVLLYALGYGACYAMSQIGLRLAVNNGSLTLTAFIKQISLVFVSLWGFIFWKAPVEINIIVGIVLISVAIYLCLFAKNSKETVSVNIKWLIFAVVLLVGNAGCSIVQKYEQLDVGKDFGPMLMFFATLFALIINMIFALREDKKDWKPCLKNTFYIPFFAGICSAGQNFFLMLLLASKLSTSIIFPTIAVGGLALTTITSFVAFKEKLSLLQWIGLAIGVVALVFLNI